MADVSSPPVVVEEAEEADVAAVAAETPADTTPDAPSAAASQPVRYFYDPVDGCQLVTVPGAAQLMGVGVRTVHGWIARGWVEIRRTPSGQARIVVATLWKRGIDQKPAGAVA